MKRLLYDWNGLNAAWFAAINQATPDSLVSLVWLGDVFGSRWGALLVLTVIHVWSKGMRTPLGAETAASTIRARASGVLVAILLAWLAVFLLKVVADFPRPLVALPKIARIVGEPELVYSFPSGHAANAMLVVAILWPFRARGFRAALLSYAGWIGWSRIAAGAHFPADVVAGFLIGGSAAVVARFAHQKPRLWR